jgi:hypothetical protein
MMKNAVRQQQHRLKKKYFNPFPLHLVPKTSPIRSMTDQEWNELVEYWKTSKGMVCFFLKTEILDIHIAYIYFITVVGDISKEQRESNPCYIPSNNRLS